MGITKENAKDFIGKWCLHDENRTGHYTKLFVNDIKEVKTGLDDGDERSLMIEYSYDKKRWQYADLTLFDHGDFIVSPFKEIKPEENEKAESSNDMKDDHHASSWFWKSVSRCEND